MTDEDGHTIEAAVQFGFRWTNDDADEYACTEAQLIAFAKACERKGLAEASALLKRCRVTFAADRILKERVATIDAELAPILATEEERYMTAQGYVRGIDEPGKRWVRKIAEDLK